MQIKGAYHAAKLKKLTKGKNVSDFSSFFETRRQNWPILFRQVTKFFGLRNYQANYPPLQKLSYLQVQCT